MSTTRTPNPTGDERQRAMLDSDRDDLLEVLTLRFGSVPESVRTLIAACHNSATLERWILVAANVPDWGAFLNDLGAGPNAFKMVGASYEPNFTESGINGANGSSGSAREPGASDVARKED